MLANSLNASEITDLSNLCPIFSTFIEIIGEISDNPRESGYWWGQRITFNGSRNWVLRLARSGPQENNNLSIDIVHIWKGEPANLSKLKSHTLKRHRFFWYCGCWASIHNVSQKSPQSYCNLSIHVFVSMWNFTYIWTALRSDWKHLRLNLTRTDHTRRNSLSGFRYLLVFSCEKKNSKSNFT